MMVSTHKEKQAAPVARRAHPSGKALGPVQHAQRTEIRNILRGSQIQPKLTIGEPNDKYEQEADHVVDQVMSMSDDDVAQRVESGTVQPKQIQRICPECEEEMAQRQPMEEEEEELQAKEMPGQTPKGVPNLESRINSLKGGGQPLDSATRSFFEPRFGHDFSNVRVHTDGSSADTAKSISARAFTLGNHVVMGENEYKPFSHSGQRLLGHELTHVIQQGKRETETEVRPQEFGHIDCIDPAQIVRRNLLDGFLDEDEEGNMSPLAELATSPFRWLANRPTGPDGWSEGADSGCHDNFCQPFTSVIQARIYLLHARSFFLAGIAAMVNTRVLSLWATYLNGGSGVQNLSSDFGEDFANSGATSVATHFLVGELRSLVEREHETLMGGADTVTVYLTARLAAARRAINTPDGNNEMNFNQPEEIAGNIAGGIGVDQTTHPFGAQPSPVNDSRDAKIIATMVRNPSGSITVTPSIEYHVIDTIDLCPGNCGSPDEQIATVPLSRFEATGLVGDVPFIIVYNAPAADLLPFTVTPAPA